MKPFLLSVLFLTGCLQMDEPVCYLDAHCDVSHEPDGLQVLIDSLVWHGVYEQKEAPPPVTWVLRGDCPDGPGFSVYSGGCAIGIYRPVEDEIWVTKVDGPEGKNSFWLTYIHEQLHAALAREGIRDHNHERLEWMVEYQKAAEILRKGGLFE